MLVSELAIVEVARAARRIGWDASAVLDECDVVLLASEILRAAADLDLPRLRTLDAIHLATTLALADSLDLFVAYDERLLEAARFQGLEVASPGS